MRSVLLQNYLAMPEGEAPTCSLYLELHIKMCSFSLILHIKMCKIK